MFHCDICNLSFSSGPALNGHTRVHNSPRHNPPKFKLHVSCIHTRREMHVSLFDNHCERLRDCSICQKRFLKRSDSSGIYCSKSCSVRATNRLRPPLSTEKRGRISASLLEYHSGKTHDARHGIKKRKYSNHKPKYSFSKISYSNCVSCNNIIIIRSKSPSRKCCSNECQQRLSSERMIQTVMARGTNNISARVPSFTYKHTTIDCDSKLEAAAVKYLIDVMNASSIDRCTSIVNYKDPEGKSRRFLPDFFVRIEDKSYIVEVKQVYRKASSVNLYNRFFSEKQDALRNFCTEKHLGYIWLDFDFDKAFEKIYKKTLREFAGQARKVSIADDL